MGNRLERAAFVLRCTTRAADADGTDHVVAHLQRHAATNQEQRINRVEVLRVRIGAGVGGQQARWRLGRKRREGLALRGFGVMRADAVVALHGNQVAAIPSSAYPTPAKRPNNSRLDTQKLQKAFALNLPEWQVGVARMLTEILEK